MRIHETKINEAAIEACLVRMKAGPFKAADITNVAIEENGYGLEMASIITDRLIQRERKARHIEAGHPYPTWKWITT